MVNVMNKSWLIGVMFILLVVICTCLALLYILPLDFKEHSPVQPLRFSHKMHAGTNAIPCLYCHRYAQKSPIAGIPSVADCRACHLYIAPDAPEIMKLTGYWDKQESIPWVRVNHLPDHVYFPHMMHLRAGIACSTCHDAYRSDHRRMERVGQP